MRIGDFAASPSCGGCDTVRREPLKQGPRGGGGGEA